MPQSDKLGEAIAIAEAAIQYVVWGEMRGKFQERLAALKAAQSAEVAQRREGHTALRVKDGKLEVFDKHPPQADIAEAAKEWVQRVQVLPVLPPTAEEGFRVGAAWARSSERPSTLAWAQWDSEIALLERRLAASEELRDGLVKALHEAQSAIRDKDGERYRWLRDNGVGVKQPGVNPYPLKWMLNARGLDIATAPDLDLAVDAAMARAESAAKP